MRTAKVTKKILAYILTATMALGSTGAYAFAADSGMEEPEEPMAYEEPSGLVYEDPDEPAPDGTDVAGTGQEETPEEQLTAIEETESPVMPDDIEDTVQESPEDPDEEDLLPPPLRKNTDLFE